MSDPVNFATRGDAYFLAQVDFQATMNLLKANVYTNTATAYANAVGTAADAINCAASAAQSALSAGAIPWISGTTYAIGDRRTSPATGRPFRRRTVGAGSTDPSLDPTNWAPVQVATPLQVVTGLVQLGVAGAAYNFVNTTAQPAATNICLYSKQFDQWTQGGTGSCTLNAAMDANGDTKMALLADTDAGALAAYFQRSGMAIANNSASWTASARFKQGTAAVTSFVLYFTGGTTVTVEGVITWGATPSIAAAGGTAQPINYLGNGIWETGVTAANNSSGNTSAILRVFPAGTGTGTTGTVYADDAQLESGTVMTSRITTTTAAVTRPAGVVAPSRLVLPASPAENDQCESMFTNNLDTNIVDPNGATVHGGAGPIRISRVSSKALVWVYINGTWEYRA
jgi:hypothetical protein